MRRRRTISLAMMCLLGRLYFVLLGDLLGYFHHLLVLLVGRLGTGVKSFDELGVLSLEFAQQGFAGGVDLFERHHVERSVGSSVEHAVHFPYGVRAVLRLLKQFGQALTAFNRV